MIIQLRIVLHEKHNSQLGLIILILVSISHMLALDMLATGKIISSMVVVNAAVVVVVVVVVV